MSLPPLSSAEKAAYLLVAAGLLFLFQYHLTVALIVGLLAHTLLSRAFRLIHGERLSRGMAKVLAAAGLGVLAAAVLTGLVVFLAGFARGRVGELPALFEKVASTLEEVRLRLQSWGVSYSRLDEIVDTGRLQSALSEWFREHAAQLTHVGGEAGKMLVHTLLGAVLGFLVFFQHPHPDPERPLAVALAERVGRLAASFDAVVMAQVEISALNTVLTAAYLFLVLPIFGQSLPFSGTLLALTFVAGLLPVVGNLISNTLIVAVSAGSSLWLAGGSLVFLVVIHKLEYFLNARIVGARVGASAWEMLLAMLVFEAAFGLPGVILAPILYAYAKGELASRGLV